MVFCGSRFVEDEEDRRLLKSMEKLNCQKEGTAFETLRDNIGELNGRMGVQDTDLIFLKGIMDSPVMKTLVKMQDKLEGNGEQFKPVSTGNLQLMKEVQVHCRPNRSRDAQELMQLLQDPHFRAMLDAHDTIAIKTCEPTPEPEPEVKQPPTPPANGVLPDAIRMVGLRKSPNEPLGVTVQVDNGELVIARILGGGMIDRQGLLRVGDVIKEINGAEVYTPEELQEQIKKCDGNITLKIMPSFNDQQPLPQSTSIKKGGRRSPSTPRTLRKLVNSCNDNLHATSCYLKALFSYNPKEDSLLPCPEIGLAFKQGDILQVLNQNDPNWWQAKNVGTNGGNVVGLIPSQELEERRKAFVRPEFDYSTKMTICGTRVSKKKKKQMYQTRHNAEFDKAELVLYEEVAKMPPFQRKTLVLLGAEGVGRRTLKMRLLSHDPHRFGTTIPYTSRPIREGEEDGKVYMYATRTIMETEIGHNKYLEYGEYNGHLYGTKLDSIRSVVRSGKMCVLDCNPQALKLLNTPEFMPYVVFIMAPGLERLKQIYDQKHGHGSRNLTFERSSSRQSRRARTLESLASIFEEEDLKKTMEENARLQRAYDKFIDISITNDDPDTTFDKLLKAVNSLSTDPQWVPVSWVY